MTFHISSSKNIVTTSKQALLFCFAHFRFVHVLGKPTVTFSDPVTVRALKRHCLLCLHVGFSGLSPSWLVSLLQGRVKWQCVDNSSKCEVDLASGFGFSLVRFHEANGAIPEVYLADKQNLLVSVVDIYLRNRNLFVCFSYGSRMLPSSILTDF